MKTKEASASQPNGIAKNAQQKTDSSGRQLFPGNIFGRQYPRY